MSCLKGNGESEIVFGPKHKAARFDSDCTEDKVYRTTTSVKYKPIKNFERLEIHELYTRWKRDVSAYKISVTVIL
jgi:hypothetical protein